MTDDSLSSHAHELDLAPAPAFAAQANGTAEMYEAAAADHEGFWAQQARERITWATDFERTLDWEVAETAIIVCDMWDDHWCKLAAHRVGIMAPRMNQVLS